MINKQKTLKRLPKTRPRSRENSFTWLTLDDMATHTSHKIARRMHPLSCCVLCKAGCIESIEILQRRWEKYTWTRTQHADRRFGVEPRRDIETINYTFVREKSTAWIRQSTNRKRVGSKAWPDVTLRGYFYLSLALSPDDVCVSVLCARALIIPDTAKKTNVRIATSVVLLTVWSHGHACSTWRSMYDYMW